MLKLAIKSIKQKWIPSNDGGQAMIEYVIVIAGVLIGALVINSILITALNKYYDLIAFIVSLPIP